MVKPSTGSQSTDSDTYASADSATNVHLFIAGESWFDPATGVIVRSEMGIQGELSSSSSGVGSGLYLNQVLMADLLENFDALDAEYETMLRERSQVVEPDAPASEEIQALEDAYGEMFGKTENVDDAPEGEEEEKADTPADE